MAWWKDSSSIVLANESSIYFRMFSCHLWKNLAVFLMICWIPSMGCVSDQGAPLVGPVTKIEIGNPPVVIVIATWLWINTYENTMFRGMNIHKSQLNFDVNYRGTIGFDPLPHVYSSILQSVIWSFYTWHQWRFGKLAHEFTSWLNMFANTYPTGFQRAQSSPWAWSSCLVN